MESQLSRKLPPLINQKHKNIKMYTHPDRQTGVAWPSHSLRNRRSWNSRSLWWKPSRWCTSLLRLFTHDDLVIASRFITQLLFCPLSLSTATDFAGSGGENGTGTDLMAGVYSDSDTSGTVLANWWMYWSFWLIHLFTYVHCGIGELSYCWRWAW